MKLKFFIFVTLLSLSTSVFAQTEVKYEDPSLIGQSFRVMKTAGFWISHHSSPDTVIMSPDAIDQFNDKLRKDKKLTKDIFTLVQDLKIQSLPDDLQKIFDGIIAKGYYTTEGINIREKPEWMETIKNNMNLNGIVVGVAPRYGLITHFAPQRFLPTNEGLYETKGDYNFDQLQNSALDTGTPVAVVHTSGDGLWYYVMTNISDGWVEAKNVAIGDEMQVKQFAQNQDFAVVIKPKADIFLNDAMTEYYDYIRMGMRLPLSGVDAGRVTVEVPVMDNDGSLVIKQGYMNAEDVNTGFLPYTARNIYKQALAMLNEPYGWGDMYGEQDCSRFLQMVFATVGLELPRDSKDQALVSDNAIDLEAKDDDASKLDAISKSSPGNTLLALKGHIMLYLGMINGRPYVIHDTTGFRKMDDGQEITYAIDRVVVSDLSLGQDSEKGSLLRRLTRTVTIE